MTTSLLIICILTCLTGLPKYTKALKNKLCCYTLKSLQWQYTLIYFIQNKQKNTASMIFQSSKFKVWVSPPFRVIFSAAAVMPPTPSPLSNFNSFDIWLSLASWWKCCHTQTKNIKVRKERKLNAETKIPNSEFQFIESTFSLKSLKGDEKLVGCTNSRINFEMKFLKRIFHISLGIGSVN